MYYLETLKNYIHLFGWRAILYALKTKINRSPFEVEARYTNVKFPFYLRLNTSDIAAAQQVFLNDEYKFNTSRSPESIVDAGANVGLTSIYFANKYPDAKIFAIEPESSNYEMLKKNTEPYSNITAIHGALWKDNEKIQLIDPGLDKWGFQIQESDAAGTSNVCETVEAMTVDAIMEKIGVNSIDLLKIDIEGAEKEVFENAENWIDSVGILIVELHDGEKTGCSRSFYNATNGFNEEWRIGENVYLINTKYIQAKPNS